MESKGEKKKKKENQNKRERENNERERERERNYINERMKNKKCNIRLTHGKLLIWYNVIHFNANHRQKNNF